MSVHDFLFHSYTGYFLLVLPVTVISGLISYFINRKKLQGVKLLSRAFFVAYLSSLFTLVFLLRAMKGVYSFIFYGDDCGYFNGILTFNGDYKLIVNFYKTMNAERVGNILAFLPFGALFTLSFDKTNILKTTTAGFLCSAFIETLQPAFGRTFDVNDLILNTLGAFVAAAFIGIIKKNVPAKR